MQRRGVVPLVAAVLTALAFLPALRNGWVYWDDQDILLGNLAFRGFSGEHLRWMFTESHAGAYQPLVWLSYAVENSLWGLDPTGYHAVNVVVHALAAAALAASAAVLLPLGSPVLRGRPRLLPWVVLGGTLAWSVHPLRVESVAWITERRDVLCGLFLLVSLRLWLVHARPGEAPDRWWRSRAYWASLAAFTASLLCKSTAMGWALVLLGLDAWLLRRPGRRRLVAEKLPFLGVAAVVAALALVGQADENAIVSMKDVGLFDRVVLAGHAASFYVAKSLLPLRLRAHYMRELYFDPIDPLLVVGLGVAVVVTVAVFLRRRRRPEFALAWGAYLVLLAPASGLVALGTHLVAERFSYLPSIPLTLLLAGALGRYQALAWQRRTRVVGGAAVVVLLALGVSTAQLCRTWNDTITLFERVVRFEPDNWMGHQVLASEHYERGDLETAERHLRELVKRHPDAVNALADLSWIAIRQERYDDAERWIAQARAAGPDHAAPLINLGILRHRRGDAAGWLAALEEAVELEPDHARANYNYALALVQSDRKDAAMEHYRRARDASPSYSLARIKLGGLLEEAGRAGEAETEYRTGLATDPGNPRLRLRLGALLLRDPLRRGEAVRLLHLVAAGTDAVAAEAKRLLEDNP